MTVTTMTMRGLVAAALLASGAPTAAETTRSTIPRELVWHGSAADLETVVVEGGKGQVRVVAQPGGEVRVTVRAELKRWSDDEPWRGVLRWFTTSAYEEDADLLHAVRLHAVSSGKRLELGLQPEGRTRTNRIAETWTVEVPPELALRVVLDSGKVDVRGIAGGVTLRLGVGDATVDAPSGDLDLVVQVGDLYASLASPSLGEVKLDSSVGDTRLFLRGARVEQPREPGPGNRIAVHGTGQYSLRAEVQVGDVEVRVP